MLERLNQERKRRTHDTRIFPNQESCLAPLVCVRGSGSSVPPLFQFIAVVAQWLLLRHKNGDLAQICELYRSASWCNDANAICVFVQQTAALFLKSLFSIGN